MVSSNMFQCSSWKKQCSLRYLVSLSTNKWQPSCDPKVLPKNRQSWSYWNVWLSTLEWIFLQRLSVRHEPRTPVLCTECQTFVFFWRESRGRVRACKIGGNFALGITENFLWLGQERLRKLFHAILNYSIRYNQSGNESRLLNIINR